MYEDPSKTFAGVNFVLLGFDSVSLQKVFSFPLAAFSFLVYISLRRRCTVLINSLFYWGKNSLYRFGPRLWMAVVWMLVSMVPTALT